MYVPEGGQRIDETRRHPFFADSTFVADPGTVDVLDDSSESDERVVPIEEHERAQLRAAVADYFARYPHVEVPSVYRLRDALRDQTLSRTQLTKNFQLLVAQYKEIVSLTVHYFPEDRALHALAFEALRAVSNAQLYRIEHEWHTRFKDRPDAYLIAPIYGRALVLAEGIRGYEEAAEYEGMHLVADDEATGDGGGLLAAK